MRTSFTFLSKLRGGHTPQAEACAVDVAAANNFPKDVARIAYPGNQSPGLEYFRSLDPPSGIIELPHASTGRALRTSHALTANTLRDTLSSRNTKFAALCEQAVEDGNFLWKAMENGEQNRKVCVLRRLSVDRRPLFEEVAGCAMRAQVHIVILSGVRRSRAESKDLALR